MFYRADLVPLHCLAEVHEFAHSSKFHGKGRETSRNDTPWPPSQARASSLSHLSEVIAQYVKLACAGTGSSVFLASADGRLFHLDFADAQSEAGLPGREVQAGNMCWWPSRHGNILALRYSPVHNAVLTLEHASTAAGEQVFLSNYHNWGACADKVQSHTIPLASTRACMGVCPRSGWVAIATGTRVTLWSMVHLGPRNEINNAMSGMAQGSSSRQRLGFRLEHAMEVDLVDLLGADETEVGGPGAAKHIDILGGTLVLATERAVFIISLTESHEGEDANEPIKAPLAGPSVPTSPPVSQGVEVDAAQGSTSPSSLQKDRGVTLRAKRERTKSLSLTDTKDTNSVHGRGRGKGRGRGRGSEHRRA
ncbi:unnamed protein product, partial [Discosporangium mesarthrocarpum]